MEPTPGRPTSPEAGRRLAAPARLAAAFTSPTAVFEDVRRKPTLVLVLLLMALAGAGAQLVILPRLDLETTIRQQMEAAGQEVSEADVTRALEAAEGFKYLGPASSLVTIPAMVALVALLFWLGLKVTGGDTDYKRVLSGTAHAWWPPLVTASVLMAIVALGRDSFTGQEAEHLLKSSLAAFLPQDTSRPLLSLAGAVDVFNVWTAVLMILALAVIGRVAKGKAAAIVLGLWGVWVLIKVGLTALTGGGA